MYTRPKLLLQLADQRPHSQPTVATLLCAEPRAELSPDATGPKLELCGLLGLRLIRSAGGACRTC